MAEQVHLAGARVREPQQRADHRRLARAVGAEEAEGAAAGDLQIYAIQRQALAKALGQATRLDGKAGGAVRDGRRRGCAGGAPLIGGWQRILARVSS